MDKLLKLAQRLKLPIGHFLAVYVWAIAAICLGASVFFFLCKLEMPALVCFGTFLGIYPIIVSRRVWYSSEVTREYDKMTRWVYDHLPIERAIITFLIVVAKHFVCVQVESLAQYLSSLLSFYRDRFLEECVHKQVLLASDLSPRAPPVFL
jgi:hypothetical protein